MCMFVLEYLIIFGNVIKVCLFYDLFIIKVGKGYSIKPEVVIDYKVKIFEE